MPVRLLMQTRGDGPIEPNLFIHDSLHTTVNVLFELRRAWPHVRPGGAVVVDDVDINDGFRIFVVETAHARSWVCEAEPIRPDDRRSNNKRMFGIILKETSDRLLN